MKANRSLNQFEEFRNAKTNLQSLWTEESVKKDRLRELEEILSKTKAADSDLTLKASKLLSGEGLQTAAQSVIIEKEAKELRDELRVCAAAIAMQKKTIQKLTSVYSEHICKAVRPEYVQLLKRMVKAVKELAEIIDEEDKFRYELFQADVHFASWIRPMTFTRFGTLKDEYSRAYIYLKEMAEYYPEALK